MKKCPQCQNDMVKYSKIVYFVIMLIVGAFIWPFLLVAPFMLFMPTMHVCKTCKKSYKDKELKPTN